jgi:hypothetical protein
MILSIGDVLGNQKINKVIDVEDSWKEYDTKSTFTPGDKYLFNFDVKANNTNNKCWLVLDSYGNDFITDEFSLRLLNFEKTSQYTLAIDKSNGKLYTASFHRNDEGEQLSVEIWLSQLNNEYHLKLPHTYLNRLDELKSKKRPFVLTVASTSLLSFIDREIGFDSLVKNLIVDFNFDGNRLELWEDSYRETSDWDDVGNAGYK